jgi:hypothetical protein
MTMDCVRFFCPSIYSEAEQVHVAQRSVRTLSAVRLNPGNALLMPSFWAFVALPPKGGPNKGPEGHVISRLSQETYQ